MLFTAIVVLSEKVETTAMKALFRAIGTVIGGEGHLTAVSHLLIAPAACPELGSKPDKTLLAGT